MKSNFIASLIIIVLASLAIWYLSSSSSDDIKLSVVVEEVSGQVTILRGGVGRAVEAGEELEVEDTLATFANARALIRVGGASTVFLPSDSSVSIVSVSADGVNIELEDGALEAVIKPNSGALALSNRGRRFASTDASLRMQVFEGVLTVDVSEGSATATGVRNTTELEAGKRLRISGESVDKSSVSAEHLLEVQWPKVSRTRETMISVDGFTDPGSVVTISNAGAKHLLTADKRGHFSAKIPIVEGENQLTLVSSDKFGNMKALSYQIERDTKAPTFLGGLK